LHPLEDDATIHFVESLDHRLIPLTERGRVHIRILHLNRPELIASRSQRHDVSIHRSEQEISEQRFTLLEAEVRLLKQHLGLNNEGADAPL
jgi:hypothetical protein